MRVLAVDDNDTNLEVMKNLCGVLGFACDLARDGAEAVEKAGAAGYDLVLMDICMPIMSGLDAALAIRALSGAAGTVPIIAVTANADRPEVCRYLDAGFRAVVAKPVNIIELLGAIQEALDPELAVARPAA